MAACCSTTAHQLRVQLQMRVLASSQRHTLHVRVTDDQDPFFLFTLDLDEGDYTSYAPSFFICCRQPSPFCSSACSLKHQQSLKVDFLSFPRDFASLLDRCIDQPGSYLCQLDRTNSATAPVTLNIMESNAFRNLSHLSLQYEACLGRC